MQAFRRRSFQKARDTLVLKTLGIPATQTVFCSLCTSASHFASESCRTQPHSLHLRRKTFSHASQNSSTRFSLLLCMKREPVAPLMSQRIYLSFLQGSAPRRFKTLHHAAEADGKKPGSHHCDWAQMWKTCVQLTICKDDCLSWSFLTHASMQIYTQKKRTGVIPPRRFVQRLKRDNELFRSYMHQVRLPSSKVRELNTENHRKD